jgi:hypothetical protein
MDSVHRKPQKGKDKFTKVTEGEETKSAGLNPIRRLINPWGTFCSPWRGEYVTITSVKYFPDSFSTHLGE